MCPSADVPVCLQVKGGLDAKAAFIHGLFSSMPTGRALIFSNSGKNAHAVAAALLAAGTRCGAVASIDEAGKTLDMASRMVIFAEVSSGVTRLLATTDLYARGVDIPGLQVVVNLDPPKKHGGGGLDKTTFTHRCGRVGRVSPEGATVGVVINLANEESIEEPEYKEVSGCSRSSRCSSCSSSRGRGDHAGGAGMLLVACRHTRACRAIIIHHVRLCAVACSWPS